MSKLFTKKTDDAEPLTIEHQPSVKKDILSALLTLVLMVAFVFLFLHFVGQRVVVDGKSMEDTLQDGDQLIVDCFTYHFLRDPERFEIVVFRLKDDPNVYYVKRVIGLPGETISIQDSKIYINGEVIDDPYATQDRFPAGRAAQTVTLGENEFFVMGDNRNNSTDSRYEEVGSIDRSQFVGRAIYRLFPFDNKGSLVPESK